MPPALVRLRPSTEGEAALPRLYRPDRAPAFARIAPAWAG